MNLERFIYLDIPGVASLYAQLRGENPIETLCSIEHGRASTLKATVAKFIGLGGESSRTENETRTTKTTLQPENMVREIVASLRAHGSLHVSLSDAIGKAAQNHAPAWFDARHPFSVPPQLEEFNQMRAVIFVSGFPPYDDGMAKNPRISMSANLHYFPSARDGQLSLSGHDALFFRKLNGKPHSFSVFGSVFECGDDFQIKPYAIRI
jgi:hypothetical protein